MLLILTWLISSGKGGPLWSRRGPIDRFDSGELAMISLEFLPLFVCFRPKKAPMFAVVGLVVTCLMIPVCVFLILVCLILLCGRNGELVWE